MDELHTDLPRLATAIPVLGVKNVATTEPALLIGQHLADVKPTESRVK